MGAHVLTLKPHFLPASVLRTTTVDPEKGPVTIAGEQDVHDPLRGCGGNWEMSLALLG